MNKHPNQWSQIRTAILNQRTPHAMLFVGPLHCGLDDFSTKIIQLLFCQDKQNGPCLKCVDCHMVDQAEHPDAQWIRPEHRGGAIKIDQIRELQNTAYLTPQRAKQKVIVIVSADRMNTASSNALLKILEEPPDHSIFILIAEQVSTILPTVLSRCFIYRFSDVEELSFSNIVLSDNAYHYDAARSDVIKDADLILDGLIAIRVGSSCPSMIAGTWSGYELDALLWFLYLVYAQMNYVILTRSDAKESKLSQLILLINPQLIFDQIEKINHYLKKISHNMNINTTLALENLLIGLANQE